MKARLSSKGQLVLPAKIRRDHGLGPGSEIELEEIPGGVLLRFVQGPAEASLTELVGCAGYRGPRKTLKDMEEAIRKGAQQRR